jgi:site-specific DNA recombinase
MKVAAIYARVSSDEQADNYSLTSQVTLCLDYAQKNGLDVRDEYIFREDYSGAERSRPELDKIWPLAQRGEIKALIVYSGDRLTRTPAHGDEYRSMLKRYGCEIHYTTRGLIGETAEEELLTGVEDQFARYERRKILERTTRGRWAKARDGKWIANGRPPFGFGKTGSKQTARLVIEEPQAEIVRRIFNMFVHDRIPVRKIAADLTEEMVPTPGDVTTTGIKSQYSGRWHSDMIYNILRNSIYCGRPVSHAKTLVEDIENPEQKRRFKRPKEEHFYGEGPAIVSEEIWQQAQEILDQGRRLSSRNEKHPTLLARLLVCSCGYSVQHHHKRPYGKNKNTYHYYECSGRSNIRGNCGLPSFPVELVDDVAWRFVVRLLSDPDHLFEEQERQFEEQRQRKATAQQQIARLSVEIEREERALRQNLEMLAYEDDDNVRAMLLETQRTIRQRLSKVRTEQDNLRQQATQIVEIEEIEQELEEVGKAYSDLLKQPDLPFALKRRLIETLEITGSLAVEDGQKILYIYWGVAKIRHILRRDRSHRERVRR